MAIPYGPRRQSEIYLTGLSGVTPQTPLAFEELERRARETLAPEAFDYVAGGAGSEATMRANLAAFDRWRIAPRMLAGAAERDLSVEVFGQKLPAPVLMAPVGVLSIVHAEAEIAAAKAAAAANVGFILSSAASRPLEEVAQAAGEATPKWFQLYWSADPEMNKSFMARAEKAGYSAIVVTLDTMSLGWRERDLQKAYLPFLRGEGVANYFSDPVFRASLPEPPEKNPRAAIQRFLSIFSDPRLTWNDLDFLRANTKLPLVLKGILRPDDARRALDRGADGVIVSNHGGRQVDGSVAALDVLPSVVEAVAGRAPVLFDSGVRRGADAFKALALGAKAVLLGRPWVYALAIGGEAGARDALRNFMADFDTTLTLCGHAWPGAAGRDDLLPAPGAPGCC
jgi:lactate 2-monooxygenase